MVRRIAITAAAVDMDGSASRALFWIAALYLGVKALAWLAPASIWFEVRSFQIIDAVEGEEVLLVVDRTVRRPFTGEWEATVRTVTEDNGVVVVCPASGSAVYQPDATFPVPLTLTWWTWEQCPPLPPGRYIVDTVWTINPVLLPQKQVSARSNVFTIHPRG